MGSAISSYYVAFRHDCLCIVGKYKCHPQQQNYYSYSNSTCSFEHKKLWLEAILLHSLLPSLSLPFQVLSQVFEPQNFFTGWKLRSSVESCFGWFWLLMSWGRRRQQMTGLIWVMKASGLQKVQFGTTVRTAEIFRARLCCRRSFEFGVVANSELSHSHRGHGQRPQIASRRPRRKFWNGKKS